MRHLPISCKNSILGYLRVFNVSNSYMKGNCCPKHKLGYIDETYINISKVNGWPI